jgi:hypothetical protein
MNRQRDAVGLTAFDERRDDTAVEFANRALRAVLLTLDRLKTGQRTNARTAARAADSLSKRGMVVLISDLLDDPES